MTAIPVFPADVADAAPRHMIEVEQYSPGYKAVRLYGDFDMTARTDLLAAVDAIEPGTVVDVDLSGVTFLYSGAANILIDAAEAANGLVRLCAPHRPVEMIITALGAGHLLTRPIAAA